MFLKMFTYSDDFTFQYDDLRNILLNRLFLYGAYVEFDSKVVNIDISRPSVTLSNGSKILGDVIIGADGAKGVVRSVVVNEQEEKKKTESGPFNYYR